MANKHDANGEKNLKVLRDKSKITQERLARILDVSRSTIAYYEAGQRKPSLDNFMRMAEILQADLRDLAEAFGYDCSRIPSNCDRDRGDSDKKN